jgi:hypothetical protein
MLSSPAAHLQSKILNMATAPSIVSKAQVAAKSHPIMDAITQSPDHPGGRSRCSSIVRSWPAASRIRRVRER